MLQEALKLDDQTRRVLDDVLLRIVEIAKPEAVILFGSRAEARERPGSDVDLLIVADTEDAFSLTADLYEALAGMELDSLEAGPSFDLVVLTPEQWQQDRVLPGQLACRADRYGVVVHGSKSTGGNRKVTASGR